MRQVAFVAGMLLSSFAVACGGGDAPPPGPTAGRQFLSLGTAPPGGAFFVVGAALSEVLDQEGGDDWQVTAEATKGSMENIRRLDAGEMDFALANAAITYFAARGEAGWSKPYPMQVVMTLAPNVALFITRQDSGIKKLADLKGQRVVVGPAGAGFEYFLRPLLEAHGVTFEDFTALHNTQSGAVDMLSDRSAAVAFIGGAVPTASITQASASQDIHFIPFEPRAVEQLVAEYRFFSPATIPAGTYRGQDVEFRGLDVGSMHLITAAATDADLVYRVTRTIYENRDKVTAKHPAGRAIHAGNVGRDTGVEFHPGAVRYYREIGIWPETGEAAGDGAS